MSCDIGEVFCHFTYITAHSPTISVALPTSHLILQPFCCITYVTAHSTALPPFHLRHRHFTYVSVHSPTLPPLHLCHSSFSKPSAASPTSQLILEPFRCFTYVTGTSRTSPGEPPMHRGMKKTVGGGLAGY